MQRVRQLIRGLTQSPAPTVTAIITFGLGIGVSMTALVATDRLLLRPLPFPEPENLVLLREYQGGTHSVGMPAAFVARVQHAGAIESLTVVNWQLIAYRMTPDDDARSLSFVRMAFSALRTLGVQPFIGRDFTEEDARLQRRLMLITHEAWHREYGGRADVIGQQLWSRQPGDPPFEIVGVLPRGFIAPQLAAGTTWHGIMLGWQVLDGTMNTLSLPPPIARLKRGVSLSQAQAEVDVLVTQMQADFPGKNDQPTVVRLEPLRDALFARHAPTAIAMLSAATLVLLVACANLAGLLLVRARTQERRVAVRLALGATMRTVVGTACGEALVLAGAGTALALVVLGLTQQTLTAWFPESIGIYTGSVLELRMLAIAVALTGVSALGASVIPSWRLANTDVLPVLQGRPGGTRRSSLVGAGLLLTLEVAVATVLAIGAVLTVRTLINIQADDVGFQPDGLYTVSAQLPQQPDRSVLLRQYLDMLDTLRAMPGVLSAGGADSLPMIGLVNRPLYGAAIGTQRCPVTGELMETLGMRLIAGRSISAADVQREIPVGVLSRDGLKYVWPHVTPEEAIGRFLEFPGEPAREVVGVVSDVRQQYLAPAIPTLYVPVGTERLSALLFAARLAPGSALRESELARRFEERGLTPRLVRVAPVSPAFELSVVNQRFRARLFAGVGVVAVVLAMIGIYAVLTATISSRLAELGIRRSLGATRGDILALVFRDVGRAVVPGIGAGLVLAWWGGTFIESLLHGIEARDIPTFTVVAVLIAAAAAMAAWLPARRAIRVDPARILFRS
jgi:predicted permease